MLIHEITWSSSAKLLMGALDLFITGSVLVPLTLAGVPMPLALAIAAANVAMLLGLYALVGKLRVSVEGADLLVGFPIHRRRIPLQTIERVAPAQYGWAEGGGWIIHSRHGATLFNVPGDQGRAVELTLRDGKRVLFSASDPDAVIAAIRTRQALAPASAA